LKEAKRNHRGGIRGGRVEEKKRRRGGIGGDGEEVMPNALSPHCYPILSHKLGEDGQ